MAEQPTTETPSQSQHHIAGLSDRQLRLIVYAALVAFLVLAAYEFYLAVEMSHDLHEMTAQVQKMSPNIQRNMDSMSQDMAQMTHSTNYMARATGQMQAEFWSLNRNITPPFSFLSGMLPFNHNDPDYGPRTPLPPPSQEAYDGVPPGYNPQYPSGYPYQGNAYGNH
ncbi:DUF948 domain-containing protein [Acidithiobacillus thiooxidans]|uniref:DUF948 domain-containing protein n=1 Tax=Acidithiobacillus thiooxidans TaxID=930 RepID=UPI0028592F1B|nr:DUF948 domain-containing protein [Acidithiobacillus thiooxidans]MDR7927312.1 DUF948 domain-containing protein [Acidithiobacillus thiooxidans]